MQNKISPLPPPPPCHPFLYRRSTFVVSPLFFQSFKMDDTLAGVQSMLNPLLSAHKVRMLVQPMSKMYSPFLYLFFIIYTSVDGCSSMVFIMCTVLYMGFYVKENNLGRLTVKALTFLSVTYLWWTLLKLNPSSLYWMINMFEMKIRSLWIWTCESDVSATVNVECCWVSYLCVHKMCSVIKKSLVAFFLFPL